MDDLTINGLDGLPEVIEGVDQRMEAHGGHRDTVDEGAAFINRLIG